MKKMYATLTLHDGTSKEVYVHVDEPTAAMLEQLEDKELVNQYLIDEFKMAMDDYSYRRHTISFEQAKEKGFDLAAPTDLLEETIKTESEEKVRAAIKQLEPQQQWLVEQVFYEGRKQSEIARELGITRNSIRDRLRVIYKKIKKVLSI